MNKIDFFDYYIDHSSTKANPIKPYVISFYHLVLVLEGTITYIANNEKIVLKKNDALLLPPGTLRERLSPNEYVHFVIVNFFSNSEDMPKTAITFRNSINKIIRSLLEVYPYKTFHCINNPDIRNTKTYNTLYNIFNCILMELFETLDQPSKNPHIIAAMKYINENITMPLTLNEVSQNIHLSKEYTSRLFKTEIGSTVSEYINKQKLTLAKDMIANHNLSLRSISDSLGYANYSYFTKIFKEYFRITPQKMRSEMNKNS